LILETFEDREHCWVGVKFLALSLEKHVPEARVRVWGIHPTTTLGRWLRGRPNTILAPLRSLAAGGWNVKPSILLRALAEGVQHAYWIDADMLVCGALDNLLKSAKPGAIVATEEVAITTEPQGSVVRLNDLGLVPGRSLGRTVNTSFMRVSRDHIKLLNRWQELLASEGYNAAQRLSFLERPIGMRGDQDVLTALVGSDEFRGLEIHLLREGKDVAHCLLSLGFRTSDRLRTILAGMPVLVHAQGPKPWNPKPSLATELSPYSAMARELAALVADDTSWTRPGRRSARVLDLVFGGHPALRGLPVTLIRELQSILKSALSPVDHLNSPAG
jgi:hypothetical protein